MKQVTITFEKTFQLRDDQDPMTAARIWETDAGFKIVAVRPADMSADNRGQADKDRLSWKGH